MHEIFVYNGAHKGDVLFARPLYRRILESGRFDVVFGETAGCAELLLDLAESASGLVVSDFGDCTRLGPPDLSYLAPEGRLPIRTWLGTYPDTHEHQWWNMVHVFNRQLAERGIEDGLELDPEDVPMVDFAPLPIEPRLHGRWVYVDNSATRSGHSRFLFDMEALARALPEHNLLCTATPEVEHPRVYDASGHGLRWLSRASEQCEVVLGKASGPFCCTYTEVNRFKPRAVCGYRSQSSPTFWDYPNNPLRYLPDMDAVLDFVTSAVARECRAGA